MSIEKTVLLLSLFRYLKNSLSLCKNTKFPLYPFLFHLKLYYSYLPTPLIYTLVIGHVKQVGPPVPLNDISWPLYE